MTTLGRLKHACRFAFNSEIFCVVCRQAPLFALKYETTISFVR
uniref:Uncharacterized protein n=1 Tax=Rhizobium rhizogenes TaxID=359 RepID=A0A7S4ZSG8_RHIRH|nr:hypothetical protein pC6.5b_415 [Rhizobium rhizogenes]QCL10463.1 hypothetical protein pC6.5c_571 [Rhizobium rhizogenes]